MSGYESLRLAASAVEMGDEWYTKKTIFSFPNYECDEDFVVEASPELVLALIAENESLRRDARLLNILVEAMAEVKATSDGESDQPIADIVSGCLAEIAAISSPENPSQ